MMPKQASILACAAVLLACGAAVRPAGAQEDRDELDELLPVRGFCIAAPGPRGIEDFVAFIDEELGPRGVNTLVLRVDYRYQFASRPEMADDGGLSKDDAAKLVAACRRHGIRLIPQINLLGHQSWSNHTGRLLAKYPEFDETPWVAMPDDYDWPNDDGLYCKSYCPRHPEVHAVVLPLIDELCDAFEADAFHAGMDEVFYIAEDKCPRCGGADPAEVFADEVTLIRDHLHAQGRELWIWGDRLIDGDATGLGEWEASTNGTHAAVDRIPDDVVVCDWHYDRPDPTAVHFAMHGLDVVSCPWKKGDVAVQQLQAMLALRAGSNREMRGRFRGVMQTVWSGADGFLREFHRAPSEVDEESESQCFRTLYDEIQRLAAPDRQPTRRILFIGQSKGYQHEAISTAMDMFYGLGQTCGEWETVFRTDCTAVTKRELPWEAKNLDAYDAVVFFTDGNLDLDDSQKADLLAFIHDDGKGFIGIHSAAITNEAWPEYRDMLGGFFDGHPWGQFEAPLVVVDSEFPGMDRLQPRFTMHDEIYQIKDFDPQQSRVLLRLERDRLDLDRDGVHADGNEFPVMWVRNYGKGRVLYNSLGHRHEVWRRPDMQAMWRDQIRWALGRTPGDASPNAHRAP